MKTARTLRHITVLIALCAASLANAQTYSIVARLANRQYPIGGLAQGLDGLLYGDNVAENKIPGWVFKITAAGKSKTIAQLPGGSYAGLLLAADGNFYGTTYAGGSYNSGSIFSLTPEGALTTLYSFCAKGKPRCPDGFEPQVPLIQASDGDIYGTTGAGGAKCPKDVACGTIFKLTAADSLVTLHTFCTLPRCPEGGGAYGSLLQASDGNFYGTTDGGSGTNPGSVYRMTPSGALTVVHDFPIDGGSLAGLIQASDGNIYGTSVESVFRVGLDGSFETLYNFCSQPNCTDGRFASAPLIQATDGNLYGTTYDGGTDGVGTIFSITTSGVLTTLFSFPATVPVCPEGCLPHGPVLQATDGNFYGIAENIVFRLSMGLAPFVSLLPAYGSAGGSITILGNNLAGATSVAFNGTPAAPFTVNSTGTAITATVPITATTGSIQVRLADGSVLTSNLPFQVTP